VRKMIRWRLTSLLIRSILLSVVHSLNILQRKPRAIHFPVSTPLIEIHSHFMHLALQQAKLVQHKYAEVPIGAVVVRNITINATGQQSFEILSQAGNQVETKVDASAHAELLALQQAARRIRNWRLLNCTMYSTLEPCPMCVTACQAFRLNALVYGAPDVRLGAIETRLQLLDIPHPFHNITIIIGGIRKDESAEILRSFFRQRRQQSSEDLILRRRLCWLPWRSGETK